MRRFKFCHPIAMFCKDSSCQNISTLLLIDTVTITLFGSSPIGTSDPFLWKKLWFLNIKIGKKISVNLTNFANVLGKVHPIFQYEKKMKKMKKKIPLIGKFKNVLVHTRTYITHEDSSHHTNTMT